jgi:osmotically-inducible protein OsmY
MTGLHEELKRQVTEQLYWDQRVDASAVGVEVRDSVVTLSGTAPSFFVRMAAEYDAWSVPGVSHVVNNIEVTFRRPGPIPSDESIRRRILDALLWDPDIETEGIDIGVETGAVTLTGTTDAYWKKIRVEEQIQDILGVRAVHNRVRVEPRRSLGDTGIATAIRDALARTGAADTEGLRVQVDNGRVRLQGRVPDRNAYIAAENVARHTLGVVDIDNTLQVRHPSRSGGQTESQYEPRHSGEGR